MKDSYQESFHKTVAKSLYVAKCAQPDIMTAILFLTKQVKVPNHNEWEKLEHMIRYFGVNKGVSSDT